MTITQVYVCSDCRYAWCMFSSLHGHSPTHIYASVAEVTTQGPLSHPEVLAIRTQSKHSLRASWLSCLAQGHFSIYFRLWGHDTEPRLMMSDHPSYRLLSHSGILFQCELLKRDDSNHTSLVSYSACLIADVSTQCMLRLEASCAKLYHTF